MSEVNKIEFIINYEKNTKVSELPIQIKVNGKLTYDYTSEGFNIYKINGNESSVCDLSGLAELDDNYVLNDSEEYVLNIEELAIYGMEYNDMIWHSDGNVFVNGKAVDTYGKYCMGSKYENNDSESFTFTLPKSTVIETKEQINKIEFVLNYEKNTKVSELPIQIKVNGKLTYDYKSEAFDVYKINGEVSSLCDLSGLVKLDDNYVLNDSEEYVLNISELAIYGMEYDSMIWQSDGRVFVNEKDISNYKGYCMGSKYENNDSESFTFTLPKSTVLETKEQIRKVEFTINYENNTKVSDFKVQVKINGKVTNEYTYESLHIYKMNSNVGSLCDLSGLVKLDDNYVLNNSEEYAIKIEELSVKGMEYEPMIWQSAETVFINGKDISTYEKYCMGSKYENRNSESFTFTLPKGITSEQTENNVQEENEQVENETTEVVIQENNNNNNQKNDVILPVSIGLGALIILVVSLVILKKRKSKKVENNDESF